MTHLIFAGLPEYVKHEMVINERIYKRAKKVINDFVDKSGYTLHQLREDNRQTDIKHHRHIFAHLLRRKTNLTTQEIGDVLDRHHSTIIHSCKVVRNWIDTNDKPTRFLRQKFNV